MSADHGDRRTSDAGRTPKSPCTQPLPPDPADSSWSGLALIGQEASPGAREKVLPWIQDQAPLPLQRNQYQTGLASLGFGLVSAAEMFNRQLTERDAELPGPAHGIMSRPAVIERESWMDAQSVERERMRDEYEKESDRTSGKSPLQPTREMNGAKQKAFLDEQILIHSPISSKNDKSKRSGRIDTPKRKDKKKHRKQANKDSDKARTASDHGERAHGESMKPRTAPHREVKESKMDGPNDEVLSQAQVVPTATQSGAADIPPPPLQFPANSNMPKLGFPWGQQARQGQETLPRRSESFQGLAWPPASSEPPAGQMHSSANPSSIGIGEQQQSSCRTPPLECSPGTVPLETSLPFPLQGLPATELIENCTAPAYDFSEGIPAASWQSPLPPLSLPYGLGLSDTQPLLGNSFKESVSRGSPRVSGDADPASQVAISGVETLDTLRARMKRNADESRLALEQEKQAREISEQRLAALKNLIGANKDKQNSSKIDGECSEAERRPENPVVEDFGPTYVETTEGLVKFYEKHSRRTTNQTDKVYDDTRPTSTTGPSFGHFGRPFSYQIDPVEHLLQSMPTAFDGFPVDPARIVLMQRTVKAQPAFGIPVSALGDFGLGFERLSPFSNSVLREDLFPDNASVKRSAYVETVSDEDDPKFANPCDKVKEYEHCKGIGKQGVNETSSRREEPVSPQDSCRGESSALSASVASLQGSSILYEPFRERMLYDPPSPRRRAKNIDRNSQALTTASLIDNLVRGSHYHDETLCQLLLAARDPGLGDAAKWSLQRAARERLMQLLSRNNHSGASDVIEPTVERKNKALPKSPGNVEPLAVQDTAPAWSQPLFEMLAETQMRLKDLDARMPPLSSRENTDTLAADDEIAEAQARAALHNLLFPNLPMEVPFGVDQHGNPHTSHHLSSNRSPSNTRTPGEDPQGIRATEKRLSVEMPEWGSSVEIPDGESSIPPPSCLSKMLAKIAGGLPTIHIQPPTTTESHSQGAQHIPGQMATGKHKHDDIALYDVTEAVSVPERAATTAPIPPPDETLSQSPLHDKQAENMRHIIQPDSAPKAWDIVSQRLISWALIWPAENFIRSLEGTALGQQVDEFALIIYSMIILKRNLRHRLCSVPPLSCDKLFVPPNMADAINRAVHAKRFNVAQQILEELWYPLGFQEPPRVIVALAKHRNDPDHWSAHRFDLPTGRLVTMSFSHEKKSLIDGRPFMWWHCIRQAWPQHGIPHPDHLAQQTRRILTAQSAKNDNSLAAMNAARNLLLGWQPERPMDMHRLRDLVWQEVKRLHTKKVKGKLLAE